MGLFSGIAKSIAGSVAGPLVGGLFGKEGQESANAASAASVQKQMDFQERMSNTAYQRGMKDMKKAGLNPMLAFMKGGASVPDGAHYESKNEMADLASGLANVNLIQAENLQASTAKQEAEAEKAKADADLASAQAAEARARTPGATAQSGINQYELDVKNANKTQKIFADMRGLERDVAVSIFEQFKANNDWNVIHYLNELSVKHGYANFEVAVKDTSFRHDLLDLFQTNLRTPELKAFADFYLSAVGKASPYVDMGAKVMNTAAGVYSASQVGRAVRRYNSPSNREINSKTVPLNQEKRK